MQKKTTANIGSGCWRFVFSLLSERRRLIAKLQMNSQRSECAATLCSYIEYLCMLDGSLYLRIVCVMLQKSYPSRLKESPIFDDVINPVCHVLCYTLPNSFIELFSHNSTQSSIYHSSFNTSIIHSFIHTFIIPPSIHPVIHSLFIPR